MDTINLEVIKESFGRVVYSHKTYEKDFEIQESYAKIFRWSNLGILVLGSSSLLSSLITDREVLLTIGSVFTFLGLGLAVFQMSFNPEQKAFKYKQTAHQLWQVREKYICLIADIVSTKVSHADIIRKRDQLVCDLDLIYKNALPTTSRAYAKASVALKQNQEMTFSKTEIDKFLPKDIWLNHA